MWQFAEGKCWLFLWANQKQEKVQSWKDKPQTVKLLLNPRPGASLTFSWSTDSQKPRLWKGRKSSTANSKWEVSTGSVWQRWGCANGHTMETALVPAGWRFSSLMTTGPDASVSKQSPRDPRGQSWPCSGEAGPGTRRAPSAQGWLSGQMEWLYPLSSEGAKGREGTEASPIFFNTIHLC